MIRPYEVSGDTKTLLQLLRLNTPDYFHPDEEQDFIDYLQEHVQDYFVLEQEGRILACGGINYFEEGKIAYLSWDMVHPQLQGKGLGSQLTRFRLDRLKQQPGLELIRVRTSQQVYKFYQKFGFQLVKTEKEFWAPGFDLYQLEIRLA